MFIVVPPFLPELMNHLEYSKTRQNLNSVKLKANTKTRQNCFNVSIKKSFENCVRAVIPYPQIFRNPDTVFP